MSFSPSSSVSESSTTPQIQTACDEEAGIGENHIFDAYDAPGLESLISRACLSDSDKRIAREKLIHKMNNVDIGVIEKINISRSAVGKRLSRTIIPELSRIIALSGE